VTYQSYAVPKHINTIALANDADAQPLTGKFDFSCSLVRQAATAVHTAPSALLPEWYDLWFCYLILNTILASIVLTLLILQDPQYVFPPHLLKIVTDIPENFIMRPLCLDDYDKGTDRLSHHSIW
jgi:hypothetical protein